MSLNEFDLIKQFFVKKNTQEDVVVGIGDDCAVLTPPTGFELCMSIDTLVSGVHFDHTFSPEDIGYKSLAVNLSDLAASGAKPAWAMLALTLPEVNASWLDAFQRGFFSHFEYYPMTLIGGDITKGPLSITIQVSGFAPTGTALLRSGARVGDRIYVTHELGDAVLALHYLHSQKTLSDDDAAKIVPRLYRPTPRIEEGIALRGIASAAIDLSDGLYGDLSHIVESSQVGATLYIDQLPISSILSKQDLAYRRAVSLHCGDAYELCFTVPPHKAIPTLPCKITCIGEITDKKGIALLDNYGFPVSVMGSSFKHF